MKVLCILSLAAVLAASNLGFARAADGFSDKQCSAATGPVRDFLALSARSDATAAQIGDQAEKVASVYMMCASLNLSYANTTGFQYANVQAAQYYFVEGRALAFQKRYALAKPILEHARKLAQDVADWRPSGQDVYRSNNVNIGSGSDRSVKTGVSIYYEAALATAQAAARLLATLPKE